MLSIIGSILLSEGGAQDLGGKQNSGKVAGAINGMGSIGGAIQGVIVASVAASSWDNVFYMLISISFLSSFVLLIPTCRSFLVCNKGRQSRYTFSEVGLVI